MELVFNESRIFKGRPTRIQDGIYELDDLLETSRKEYEKANPGNRLDFLESHLALIGHCFVWNAIGSIMSRYSQKEEYSGLLTLELSVENDKLRLEVEDNGKGIDPEIRTHIFVSDKALAKGTLSELVLDHKGKTLLQAKSIIKGLGGEVGYVDKGLNNGAVFWYEVPLDSIKRTV